MDENSIMNQVLNMIAEWSPAWKFFGLAFIFGILAFWRFPEVRKFVITVFTQISGQNSINPLNHPLFLQNVIMQMNIDDITFTNKHKTWLFRTLLTTKINTAIVLINEYIKSREWKKQNKFQLQSSLLLLTRNIVAKYEIEIQNKYERKYGDNGRKLFEIIYNSQGGFKSYHKKNVNNIFCNINKMFMVENFSAKKIINSYLLLIWVALDTSINDCALTFKALNGSLTEIIDNIEKT